MCKNISFLQNTAGRTKVILAVRAGYSPIAMTIGQNIPFTLEN